MLAPEHLGASARDLQRSNAALRAQLADNIELLHLWKNEAFTYRLLAEAVATGRYSPAQAKEALAKGAVCPDATRLAFLPLDEPEYRAFVAIAGFAELSPRAFLWSCLDAVMTNSADEDLLAGCAEAARKRFDDGALPDWAR